MPSGSFSKRARSVQSVTNKKNCGGNKKAGLAPRSTGPVEFRNTVLNKQGVNFKIHQAGLPCPETYRNNPGGQCAGGVGALASTRARGCRNLGASAAKKNNIPTAQYSFSYYYDGPDATPIALRGPIINVPPNPFNVNTIYGAVAQSINNNKQIVGAISDIFPEENTLSPAFWSSPSAQPIRLKGIAGGNVIGSALDINNEGEIVGYIKVGNDDKPVYWSSPTANAVELALGGNTKGAAISINDDRNIVGLVDDGVDGKPAYWDNTNPTTTLTILNDNGGTGAVGSARSINNSGEIVGNAEIDNGAGGTISVPFYWSDEITDGQPLKDTGGNTNVLSGQALSINDNSTPGNNNIVGIQNNKAVFWSKDTVNALELVNDGKNGLAISINNSGAIIGRRELLVGGYNLAYWGNSTEVSTLIRTPFEIDTDENIFIGISINNNGNFISSIILFLDI